MGFYMRLIFFKFCFSLHIAFQFLCIIFFNFYHHFLCIFFIVLCGLHINMNFFLYVARTWGCCCYCSKEILWEIYLNLVDCPSSVIDKWVSKATYRWVWFPNHTWRNNYPLHILSTPHHFKADKISLWNSWWSPNMT